MTQPLNYTTKAIKDIMRLRDSRTLGPGDKQGMAFIADLLRRAEVFLMPDSGTLLDRSKVRPEVPAQCFHPPFPVVALEYRSLQKDWGPTSKYEATSCSKRIALAWEWDGKMPGGKIDSSGPAAGEGVVVACIGFFDHVQMWMPTGMAAMVPYDAAYIDAPPGEHAEHMLASGRINAKQAKAKRIEIRGLLPLMPEGIARGVAEHGFNTMQQMMLADLMDEFNAYCDLCIALGCTNVSIERHSQSWKLNRSRIKASKAPLKDFHVLKIAGQVGEDGPVFGGSDGVRSHLRRGHVRRLAPDRMTWVNACMVRSARAGFVDKHYTIGGAS